MGGAPCSRKARGNARAGSSVAAVLKACAAAVPRPMSVNMLRCRVVIDSQARSKKGHPPHTTTGVASASCASASGRNPTAWRSGSPRSMSPIDRARTAIVGPRPHQNRRFIRSSSGFGGSSADGTPPIASGSSAIPQIGQGTGSFSRTSGSMGQTHTISAPAGAGGGDPFGIPPGPCARNVPGSAENRARHFALQKKNRRPACSSCPPFGAFGFTSIPHTGSTANHRSGSDSNRARQVSEQKA